MGENWRHVYVWLSPFVVHLKLSQHCQLAIHQHKFKSLKIKFKCNKSFESEIPLLKIHSEETIRSVHNMHRVMFSEALFTILKCLKKFKSLNLF